MTIAEIIELTENKIKYLKVNRDLAFARGDLDTVTTLDNSMVVTQETLTLLRTLV